MKHNKLRRWMGLLFALPIVLAAVLPAAALTPAYPVTGPYLSSTYYKNLLQLPRTGDRAFDAVAIALSQLDYHEGNSTADFDGENKGGYRNYTEYNYAFGQVGGTYGYAWCAAFVSWCLEEAEAADSAGGLFASCTLWVERLRELGQYSTRSSGYSPKAGDLIFFRSAGVSRASDHVGLVRYVKGGRVYTVEGNSSDQVSLRDYALGDTYIVGYGRPRYQSNYLLPKSALACEDKVAGWYTVTNSFVNIRAGAGSGTAKRGQLQKGELVCIINIQNGWGCFYYKEKLSYISLDYADFTAPLLYRVSYDAAEGEGAPATHTYYSMSAGFVSKTTPTREGYIFLGWQDSTGKRYAAGALLPAGDVTLAAVWEKAELPAPPASDPAPGGDASAVPPADGETTAGNAQDGFLHPVEGEIADTVTQASPVQPIQNPRATLAAGVATALLVAAVGAWLLYRRLRA